MTAFDFIISFFGALLPFCMSARERVSAMDVLDISNGFAATSSLLDESVKVSMLASLAYA